MHDEWEDHLIVLKVETELATAAIYEAMRLSEHALFADGTPDCFIFANLENKETVIYERLKLKIKKLNLSMLVVLDERWACDDAECKNSENNIENSCTNWMLILKW